MAALGEQEGQLNKHESEMLKNLFRLREIQVQHVMTPRSVVFSMPEEKSVKDLLSKLNRRKFSRIPVYSDPEKITGFVRRDELLIAQNEGQGDAPLTQFRRDLSAVVDASSVLQAFELSISASAHILLVVNEYGETRGIITLEDILESLLGLEIVDELDKVEDMQALAKRLGNIRRKRIGLDSESVSDELQDENSYCMVKMY